MSMAAVVMMIVALVLVWGGWLAAIVHLRRHPDESGDDG